VVEEEAVVQDEEVVEGAVVQDAEVVEGGADEELEEAVVQDEEVVEAGVVQDAEVVEGGADEELEEVAEGGLFLQSRQKGSTPRFPCTPHSSHIQYAWERSTPTDVSVVLSDSVRE